MAFMFGQPIIVGQVPVVPQVPIVPQQMPPPQHATYSGISEEKLQEKGMLT